MFSASPPPATVDEAGAGAPAWCTDIAQDPALRALTEAIPALSVPGGADATARTQLATADAALAALDTSSGGALTALPPARNALAGLSSAGGEPAAARAVQTSLTDLGKQVQQRCDFQ